MKKTLSILCFFFGLAPTLVYGQSSCAQTLTQARAIYDEGRIHELSGILANCLEDGFTDEEKTEAYKLLVLSYIYQDLPDKADEAMLALLNHNHEFQINRRADPAEFINLYNTFRTRPIFLWGFKGGGTYTFTNVQKLFGVNSSGTEPTSYSSRLNFAGGLTIEKGFSDQFGAMAELLFTNNQYEVVKQLLSDPRTNSGGNLVGEPEPYATTTSLEVKSWITLNLAGYYRLLGNRENKKLDPRIFIGPSINVLLQDRAEIRAEFPLGGEQATGPDEQLYRFRNPVNIGVMAGISGRTKVGKQYLTFEAKYNYGLLNITEFNYDQTRLSTFYGYALDDVTISHLSISLGLLFQKYNPKKLTK